MALKKDQFIIEFPINASPSLIFELVSTSNGLQEWFADKVDESGDEFIFTWGDSEDVAYMVETDNASYIRYRWEYQNPNEYFEFRIERSPITNETILKITDFADKFDMDSQKLLWEKQINDLKNRIGS